MSAVKVNIACFEPTYFTLPIQIYNGIKMDEKENHNWPLMQNKTNVSNPRHKSASIIIYLFKQCFNPIQEIIAVQIKESKSKHFVFITETHQLPPGLEESM